MSKIVLALLILLPFHATATQKGACEAHLGFWEGEIEWRADSGENLTGDYVYLRDFVDAKFVRDIGELDQKVRLKYLNNLNQEILEIKQSVFHAGLEDLSQEYQEAKQPARNRQMLRMILLQPEMKILIENPTLKGVENFLSLLTSGASKGKFAEVLKTVRRIQSQWGQKLKAGEWVEILGSWPNLESNSSRSDVDIFLSRKLEGPYRRAIHGGLLEDGTLARPIRMDDEAILVRNRYLELEEFFRAVIGRPVLPGHLLSVALRVATIRKGQTLIDESDALFRRFMTMISPISFLISKDQAVLRINDGISPGKERGPKVAEIPLN